VRFGRLPIPPECLPDPPSLPRDWMQTNYWATDSRRPGIGPLKLFHMSAVRLSKFAAHRRV
jgi:hypothetical protein